MITTYGNGTQETINRFNAIDQAIKEGRIVNQTMSQTID
jgi:hypothetical protein